MDDRLIEHLGVVQRVEGGKAFIAMDAAGCASCGHGSHCGIGQMASGRALRLLTLPVGSELKAGDRVAITLPESRLTACALVGYLFPAFAMLLGAWSGAAIEGSDGGTALGAIVGFFGALAIGRLVVGLLPGLLLAPQLILLADRSILSPEEFDHEP